MRPLRVSPEQRGQLRNLPNTALPRTALDKGCGAPDALCVIKNGAASRARAIIGPGQRMADSTICVSLPFQSLAPHLVIPSKTHLFSYPSLTPRVGDLFLSFTIQ